MTLNQALVRAKSYAEKGQMEKARQLYLKISAKFPQNQKAKKGLEALGNKTVQRTGKYLAKPAVITTNITIYTLQGTNHG